MGCRGCGGLGAKLVPALKTGGGVPVTYPCPADHPYFPKNSTGCDPTNTPWAYKSTINGGYVCLNGATPAAGSVPSVGKSGMVCPGARGAVPNDPNAPQGSASAAASNTTYYVIGGLVVLGLAAYIYLK